MMKKLLSLVVSAPVLLCSSGGAQALMVPGPLVNTTWLQSHTDQVVILDVRNDVKSFTARPILTRSNRMGNYRVLKVGGHIPGANLVDYAKICFNREVNGKKVEMVAPSKVDFEHMMRAAGVRKDSPVIIVSKGVSGLDLTMATRLYWQLKYYGENDVAILNGGMAKWLVDNLPISFRRSHPSYGNWVAAIGRNDIRASTEDVRKALKDGVQLVDDRPLSEYMGVMKKSYVFEKGHIPGAKDDPISLMTSHGKPDRWLPIAELRAMDEGIGIKTNAPTITYCNRGHLASGGWFVMHELLGDKNVRLYDGSMNAWTLNKGRTVVMRMD